jgi:hypothetical protein
MQILHNHIYILFDVQHKILCKWHHICCDPNLDMQLIINEKQSIIPKIKTLWMLTSEIKPNKGPTLGIKLRFLCVWNTYNFVYCSVAISSD